MKVRILAATAAFALVAGVGAASASTLRPAQEMAIRDQVTHATSANGQVIPQKETESWEVGETVPDEYASAPVENVQGMKGYSYVRDRDDVYVLNPHRKIVDKMRLTQASGANGQTTPGANGRPESLPAK